MSWVSSWWVSLCRLSLSPLPLSPSESWGRVGVAKALRSRLLPHCVEDAVVERGFEALAGLGACRDEGGAFRDQLAEFAIQAFPLVRFGTSGMRCVRLASIDRITAGSSASAMSARLTDPSATSLDQFAIAVVALGAARGQVEGGATSPRSGARLAVQPCPRRRPLGWSWRARLPSRSRAGCRLALRKAPRSGGRRACRWRPRRPAWPTVK